MPNGEKQYSVILEKDKITKAYYKAKNFADAVKFFNVEARKHLKEMGWKIKRYVRQKGEKLNKIGGSPHPFPCLTYVFIFDKENRTNTLLKSLSASDDFKLEENYSNVLMLFVDDGLESAQLKINEFINANLLEIYQITTLQEAIKPGKENKNNNIVM